MANFVVSAEHAVKILNEAFKLDPKAIKDMAEWAVTPNENLINHPTIQCSSQKIDVIGGQVDFYTLRLTGLLNGIFGVDEHGQGPIARKYDEHGNFAGFCINTNLKEDACPVGVKVTTVNPMDVKQWNEINREKFPEGPHLDGSIDYDCGR